MSAGLAIPADAIAAQRRASDPAVSAWVSAHAGSGKTHVLTQRVIRLLLAGVPPARILCLTYTKAAAANMSNRVFRTLARWTTLPDASLDAILAEMEGRTPDPAERENARRLFARALEVPGGLKVQTIHAFCERLLHRFPFEAGVPVSFSVLDDRQAAALSAEVKGDLLREAEADREGAIARALDMIARLAAESVVDGLFDEIVKKRADIAAWIGEAGGLDPALGRLAGDLGLAEGRRRAEIEGDMLASPHLPQSEWASLARFLRTGKPSDAQQAERLERAFAGAQAERLAAYLEIFFTQERKPRAALMTGDMKKAEPELATRLSAECERLIALLEEAKAARIFEASTAFFTLAERLLGRYEAAKAAPGLLDFDDLIARTERLLADSGAAWILYKLDGGIDHILVDEAQDTSPAQWRVIDALAGEFFAGEGVRRDTRTLFAVGDDKQSIFSFQGADPAEFARMRHTVRRRAEGAELGFDDVPLRYSFRSTPQVLKAVDTVFARAVARAGLSHDPDMPGHEAVRRDGPGFVEFWPVLVPDERGGDLAWDAPLDAVSEESPAVALARRIAGEIGRQIREGERLPDGTRVGAGDFVVLVRTRGALFEALIRALKDENVPVAGADRLKLGEHIAVMDCLAALDFVLMPNDDLTLASLLKSPLIGLDEDALFHIAHARRSTLWRAMREAADEAGEGSAAGAARARLAGWLGRADFLRPYSFLAEMLGAEGGRRRILARLGPEANDALDELLNLALAYEEKETPSLQGFLAWLRAVPTEAIRSLDEARDEVRVMTVHNAKGLEAPIVVLADTCSAPAKQKDPVLIALEPADGKARPPSLAWRVGGDEPQAVAAAREREQAAAQAEHRRLLYVALTRARDRLYVCGCQGTRKRPDGNWYDLIADALRDEADEIHDAAGEVTAWRWALPKGGTAGIAAEREAARDEAPLPDWIARPAANERVPRPIAPSSVLSALEAGQGGRGVTPVEKLAVAGDALAGWSLDRGRLVHKLLQFLPDMAAGERRGRAERFLAREAGGRDAQERADLVSEVLTVLESPDFGAVFAAGSRAELSVAGLVDLAGEAVPVSGRIDRLAVTADEVLIVDFKANRLPPAEPAAVPRLYLAQLAAYRALVGRLYPDRPVRAALIWTATAKLMPIPADMLDEALRRGGGDLAAPAGPA